MPKAVYTTQWSFYIDAETRQEALDIVLECIARFSNTQVDSKEVEDLLFGLFSDVLKFGYMSPAQEVIARGHCGPLTCRNFVLWVSDYTGRSRVFVEDSGLNSLRIPNWVPEQYLPD